MQKLPAALKHAITESALDGWVDLTQLRQALLVHPYPPSQSFTSRHNANIWAALDKNTRALTLLADRPKLIDLLRGAPGVYHFKLTPATRDDAQTLIISRAGPDLLRYAWGN